MIAPLRDVIGKYPFATEILVIWPEYNVTGKKLYNVDQVGALETVPVPVCDKNFLAVVVFPERKEVAFDAIIYGTSPSAPPTGLGLVIETIPSIIVNPDPILTPPSTELDAVGKLNTALKTLVSLIDRPEPILTPPKVSAVAGGKMYPLNCLTDNTPVSEIVRPDPILTAPNLVVDAVSTIEFFRSRNVIFFVSWPSLTGNTLFPAGIDNFAKSDIRAMFNQAPMVHQYRLLSA